MGKVILTTEEYNQLRGQVALSVEEYNELKAQADVNKAMKEAVESLKESFSLKESYNGQEICLAMKDEKAAEIFTKIFEASEFNNGAYDLQVNPSKYSSEIASYRINAVKKEESEEATKEDEE